MILSDYSKRIYRDFNKTILALCIFSIFIPLIIGITKHYFPRFYGQFRCTYYTLTQLPCPFCGITTDFKNILTGNIIGYKYNLISIPLMMIMFTEFFMRIVILINKRKFINIKTISIDIVYHSILLVLGILYIITFLSLNLKRF